MDYKSAAYLVPGSHVKILCTARSATKESLEPAVRLLESWKLKVSLGRTIGSIHHQFGGTKEERLADFQQAIDDQDVDAIWIARGGYGTVQLIDLVDFSAFAKAEPKIIIGYSDVTLLHGKLQHLGYSSVHSFMPLELIDKPENSVDSLRKALFGESRVIEIENTDRLKEQSIKAPITGGNLSILYSMLGSDSFPPTENQVLFIEDIDEYLYHIERMMYSLKRAGKLNHLVALVVGGMSDMRDHEIPFGKDARQIIKDLTASFDYPVIFNFPAGHVKEHHSLHLGKDISIHILSQKITFTQ